jgi:UDP-3-O-[3-hydroxymyristoyl] glucosamine N-acyltransferase
MGYLKACVAVVEDIPLNPRKPSLYQSQNADLAMSQVLEMFAHPMPVFCCRYSSYSAVVDNTAVIGVVLKIGACCYIGPT